MNLPPHPPWNPTPKLTGCGENKHLLAAAIRDAWKAVGVEVQVTVTVAEYNGRQEIVSNLVNGLPAR